MRKLLELLGLGLLAIAASSVVHHFTDWFAKWALLDHLPFLDGYELYASGVVGLLGFGALCAGDLFPEVSSRTPARTSARPDSVAGAGAPPAAGAGGGAVSAGADPGLPG
ncbi:hypothetical protein [Streptomyces sp. NPDC057702]|uniref:hypothetical protein n=1 Tax=unclassified Streptomyces TaxID=2593676 RepID=UPI0036B16A99